jgi:type IV pilus assembly protein PilA
MTTFKATLAAADDGFTLIELLIVAGIIGVLSAVAVPGLIRARMAANEASAIGSLRSINSAQVAFSSACAGGAYAIDLADLVRTPASGGQGFISPDLASNGVLKSGYLVSIEKDASLGVTDMAGVTVCNGATGTPASSYFAKADPVTPGGTGIRFFATSTRGTIFYSAATIANPIIVTPVMQ